MLEQLLFVLQAMSYQQRAVFMSERVLGVDHPNTITEYVSKDNNLVLILPLVKKKILFSVYSTSSHSIILDCCLSVLELNYQNCYLSLLALMY